MVRGKMVEVHEYVAAVHAAPEFLGVTDFHRRFARYLGHERTLARRRRQVRSSLRVFPSFTVEALGLSHVHVIVLGRDRRWLRFPYAVEYEWATRDFVQQALYLHCLVPTEHVERVEALIRELSRAGWGTASFVLSSQSGWQHFSRCGHDAATQPVGSIPQEPELLRQYPLAVAVIAEAWDREATLPSLWRRIEKRLGRRVQEFLPRRRVLHTNGKEHIRAACTGLARAGLFRQQLIRFTPEESVGVEVLLMDRDLKDHMVELLAELHGLARVTETYAGRDGIVVDRLLGSSAVLNAILHTTGTLGKSAAIFFVEKRTSADEVRFAYDLLFNPKTGTWEFPRDRIMEHLAR
jgi:hypothetical protein